MVAETIEMALDWQRYRICVCLFSLSHSTFVLVFPPSHSIPSHLFRVFSISFSAHNIQLYTFSLPLCVCVCYFFLPATRAYSTRRIQFLSVCCIGVCVFFCCCEKCVVTLLNYSVREFIRGKYMRAEKRVNVSEFKWREC